MNRDQNMPVPQDSATVGPYHLVSVLGEGGFGVVYLAERRSPYVQAVALKVLKAGMDTPSLVARFELERQALALMDHPNVAHVLDGGVTPEGCRLGTNRPYFVMELVAGKPINDFCREHRLSIDDRLRLFIPVCEAVQHAHTKGVVHRDLKPSNILVMRGEAVEGLGEPTPKVIDFGVAKALSGSSLEQEKMTRAGNFIGTPEYMSPEQAAGGGAEADLDTRTDVYSLGVVLYELLTGTLPFDRDELWRHDVLGMMRIIREVEPPRPSTRVSESARTPKPDAAWPEVGTSSLTRQLRGDLDWIVMRALEKARERRYQSPGSLAADISRYLRTEPVEAGPPSATYKASKFVRRHRALVAAAAFSAIALVVGAGVAVVQWRQAVDAQAVERNARMRTEAANKFIDRSIETMRLKSGSDTYTLSDFVEFLARTVGVGNDGLSTEDRAVTRTKIGEIFAAMGRPKEAQEQFTAAIADLKGERLASSLHLARASLQLVQLRVASGRQPEALELLKTMIPELRKGKVSEIRELLPEALAAQGQALFRMGKGADAEQSLREAVRLFGQPNDLNAQKLCNALIALAQGLCEDPSRREQALHAAQEAVNLAEEWATKNPSMRITALNTLGRAHRGCGNTDEAIDTYARAIELARNIESVPISTVASIQVTLAQALRDVGRLDEATRYAEAGLKVRRSIEPDSLRVAEALDVTAGLAADRNDLSSAESQYREQLRIAQAPDIRNEPMAALAMTGLADVLVRQEKFDEAKTLAERALRIRVRTLPKGHWKLHSTESIRAAAMAGLGECKAAEQTLTAAAEAVMDDRSTPPAVVKRVVQRLIVAMERCQHGDAAASWRERLKKLESPEL